MNTACTQILNTCSRRTIAVSLVTTVWNDIVGCQVFFSHVLNQTCYPSEIIITDAGSRDGTWEFLKKEEMKDRPWKLILRQEPGCNVARGRNLAIEQAGYEIIASTDIGCEWDPEWLEELTAPLFDSPQIDMVAGSWAVKYESLSSPWALTEWAMKGCKHESVALPVTFASSRSIAYRKRLWQEIGGYPEDLTLAGDDTVFGHLMHLHGAKPASAPRIRCYWHRHNTLKGYLNENFRNFVGEGEANLGWNHFFLVGGRLLVEFCSLIFGLVFLLAGVPMFLTGVFFLIFFLSSLLRLRSWLHAAKHLGKLGVKHPLFHVFVFDMLFRIMGLQGFIVGIFRGNSKCRDVRRRLCKPLEFIHQ